MASITVRENLTSEQMKEIADPVKNNKGKYIGNVCYSTTTDEYFTIGKVPITSELVMRSIKNNPHHNAKVIQKMRNKLRQKLYNN